MIMIQIYRVLYKTYLSAFRVYSKSFSIQFFAVQMSVEPSECGDCS